MLWDVAEQAFEAMLRSLSAPDLAIALPDEGSDSPFACCLFFDGEETAVGVFDDDESDETIIHGHAALRERLSRIAA